MDSIPVRRIIIRAGPGASIELTRWSSRRTASRLVQTPSPSRRERDSGCPRREVREGPAHPCPYQNFCAFTGANYAGYEYDFYYGGHYDTSHYLLYGGSWSNNQTQHRRVDMFGSNGKRIYTTPDAFYDTPSGD